MSIAFSLFIIAITAFAIYLAGEKFATSSSRLGNYLRLPPSVKAATFDAISSSLPELLVALFSIIAFGTFEMGIGTIAGSAFFNMLIIPGVCVGVTCRIQIAKRSYSSRWSRVHYCSNHIIGIIAHNKKLGRDCCTTIISFVCSIFVHHR